MRDFLSGFKKAIEDLGREGDYREVDWSAAYKYLQDRFSVLCMLDEEEIEDVPIKGKIVLRAIKSKDHRGYDLLHIDFIDGTNLEVLEEGQEGYFSCRVGK